MNDIVFLTLDEVLEIHEDQIELYGGSPGIRDIGLLESAMAMPSTGFGEQYLHDDLFDMAAAYLFHITCNHPFIDGNKRVGAVAAAVFLLLNGFELLADEKAFENIVRRVAEGVLEKVEIASFIRQNSEPIK